MTEDLKALENEVRLIENAARTQRHDEAEQYENPDLTLLAKKLRV